MLNHAGVALVLALAVASASFTIARTKAFASFRAMVSRHNAWLGSLVTCPYCVSHYLALAGVLTYWPDVRLLDRFAVTDGIATWMAIVAISAAILGVVSRAIAPLLPPTGQPPTIRYSPPPPPPMEAIPSGK